MYVRRKIGIECTGGKLGQGYMSFSQSRSDKNDSAHYRKSGRSASFNQPRTSSGAHGEGGAPAPSPSLSSSVASNRRSDWGSMRYPESEFSTFMEFQS